MHYHVGGSCLATPNPSREGGVAFTGGCRLGLPQHILQVDDRFSNDVVVRQRSAVLEQLADKDEPVLIWRNLRTGLWREE